MTTRRRIVAGAIGLIIAAALAGPALAQVPASRLGWQQRFLGILPLVKPDPKDPIIARVDGIPITLKQVNDYAKIEAQLVNANSEMQNRAVWRDALNNLVNRQVLIDAAERRGIKVSDAEVAERARQFEIDNASGEQVSGGIAPSPLLLKQVQGSMLIEKMLDQEFAQHHVAPTPADIERYYNNHKDLFVATPGAVRLSHIAVALPHNATDAQKKAAYALIRKYYRMAQKTGDFAALAKKISQDPQSAPKGGDLGYFRPGELPPVVSQQAFSTPVGGLSKILGSDLGYSFLKVTAKREPTYAPLSKVRQKIAMVILGYNQNHVVISLLHELVKQSKIKFNKPPTNAKILG